MWGFHCWTRGSSPRAPATKFAPPVPGLGGVHFFAAAIAISMRQPEDTGSSSNVGTAQSVSRRERAMKGSEFLACGFAKTGTGAVLVLPGIARLNY